MNIAMWWKALQVIPRISKQEWDRLDVISRWLIATRAAVLIMTFLSAAIAGILALPEGAFDLVKWLLVVLGLCLAHATNNLLNDYVDYARGVDPELGSLFDRSRVEAHFPADALAAPVTAHGQREMKIGGLAAQPVL